MSESNNAVKFESGSKFPFDLYVATIWKARNHPTDGFLKAIEAGSDLGRSCSYTLYTNGVQSDIECNGFAIFENTSMLSVVCKEVSPKAILAYRTELERYRDVVNIEFNNIIRTIDETLRSLTYGDADGKPRHT